MNKIYSLLGIGLLSAATLSSCGEDAVIEETNQVLQQGKEQAYTTTASIQKYEATEESSSTRANVQENGRSFMWNTDDKVTIWDGTNGYDFTTVEYDDNEPSWNVEFAGNGSLTDGATVWGIYPKKESPSAENVFSFTLEDNVTQSLDKPELQNTMHMLAKGTVNGNTVTNLNFEHLTALFQFSIRNLRPENYKVVKVSVACDEAIFPKTLTISGEEKVYSDKVSSLTLNYSDMDVDKNGTSYGYLSFFPMPDMTKDTKLTFTLTVQKEGGADTEDIVKDVKTIGELYNEASAVAGDGYKYVAGKRYGVSFSLIAELGYEVTAPDTYLVKKNMGLINLAGDPTIMSNTGTVITLDTDLDWTAEDTWTPIAAFAGTLDGNGKTITGLSINIENATTGLIVANSGTIKNLKIKNASLTGTMSSGSNVPVGTFAGTNTGKIEGCTIEGGIFTVPANCLYGGFVGQNNGTVSDCQIMNVSDFSCQNAGTNIGGIVGKNMGTLEGSSADNVTLTCSKGTIGGLVGWNNGGTAKIVGCYSLANIVLTGSVNSGLLAGGCNWTNVIASFAVGSITAPAGANAARGGLVNQGGTINGCYSIPVFNNLTGNANTGGVAGKSAGGINTTNCYFVSTDVAISAVAGAAQAGVDKLATNADLVNKLSELNANAKVATSGYEFVVNEGSNKDVVPLLVQKKK
ncbi:hypothetical protein [Bacteroides congonensis]|uniref:hypothetical protein n=1 Tax=Bacteroides congonensis TaxID=1871006 RepID=UPI003A87BD8A